MFVAMQNFAKLFDKGADKLMVDEHHEPAVRGKKVTKVSVNTNDDLFSC